MNVADLGVLDVDRGHGERRPLKTTRKGWFVHQLQLKRDRERLHLLPERHKNLKTDTAVSHGLLTFCASITSAPKQGRYRGNLSGVFPPTYL